MTLYFIAIKGLAVADLTMISRFQPMLVAAMAPLFLGADERVGWKVWLLLALGLAGCAVLVAPGLSMGSAYGLFALGGTFLSGGAYLCLRTLGRTDDPRVVVFWFQCVMLVLAVLGSLLESGRALAVPSISLVPALVGAGLAAVAGQLLVTFAYREDRAAVVSAAEYTAVFWALLADILVLSILPSPNALLGGALILGAGLALLFVEDRPRSDVGPT
jgi:drug/metabolite transporter (DMT)-like permease